MAKSDKKSDPELLALVKEGDHAAFTRLYTSYYQNCYLYAYKLVEDSDEAADMVQELFVNLWEKREQLTLNGPIRAYLYQALRHKFLNLQSHQKVRESFVQHFQAYLDAGEDSTSNLIEEKELHARLERFVSRLPGKAGQVFSLKQANLSDEEIAGELKISHKTVQNLMSQAIRILRSKFSQFLFFLFLFF